MDEPGRAYWERIQPIWSRVRPGDDLDIFLLALGQLIATERHLVAAHWCQSEVRNGGFHQFFGNPTGVLAPEAQAGFAAIGIAEWAACVGEAMAFFGAPYPRSQLKRHRALARRKGATREEWDPFVTLDAQFYAWNDVEDDRWERAADAYALANPSAR